MVLVWLICIGRRVNVVSMKFVKTGALYLARGGLVLERFVLDGLDCSFGWSRVLLVDQSQFRLDDVPKVWLLVRNTRSSHTMGIGTILSPVLFLLPSWKKYCQTSFRNENEYANEFSMKYAVLSWVVLIVSMAHHSGIKKTGSGSGDFIRKILLKDAASYGPWKLR